MKPGFADFKAGLKEMFSEFRQETVRFTALFFILCFAGAASLIIPLAGSNSSLVLLVVLFSIALAVILIRETIRFHRRYLIFKLKRSDLEFTGAGSVLLRSFLINLVYSLLFAIAFIPVMLIAFTLLLPSVKTDGSVPGLMGTTFGAFLFAVIVYIIMLPVMIIVLHRLMFINNILILKRPDYAMGRIVSESKAIIAQNKKYFIGMYCLYIIGLPIVQSLIGVMAGGSGIGVFFTGLFSAAAPYAAVLFTMIHFGQYKVNEENQAQDGAGPEPGTLEGPPVGDNGSGDNPGPEAEKDQSNNTDNTI